VRSAAAEPAAYINGGGNLQPETNYKSETSFVRSVPDCTLLLLDKMRNDDIQNNYEVFHSNDKTADCR
jgi:hypothetical protein